MKKPLAITAPKYDEFDKLIGKLIRTHNDWSRGRAVFYAAYNLFPEFTKSLQDTEMDCREDDSKIGAFLSNIEIGE